MPEGRIPISTTADLSGINAVRQGLLEIRALAQELAKHGLSLPANGGGGAVGSTPQTFTETAKQRIGQIQQQVVGSTIGAQAIRGTMGPMASSQPSGVQVGEWMEQNMPIINAMMGATGGRSSVSNGRVPKPQKYVPKPGTIPTPQNISRQYRNKETNTPSYYNDWFLAAGRGLTVGSAMHDEWHAANTAWIQGESSAPQTFYKRFASDANMVPVPNAPSAPGGNNKGGGLLGNVIKAALPARGIAGALGSAIGGVGLGGLALGGAAAGAVALGINSFGKYMDSGSSLSDLTKQILSTRDSLEALQSTVNSTGAAMGFTAQQTAQVANTLGVAFGSMSLSQMNQGIAQVTGMSRAYGVSANVLAQGFGAAAQLGLTTGNGSMLNQGQLAFNLANSAGQSGMSGRMADLMQEFLTVVQGTQATNPIANPNSLLSIITAMNANLPRSMTGAGGAAVLNQVGSAIANPNGLQQLINYQALSKAGVSGYFNIMNAQQMGPGNVLPNGQMNAQAIFGQYNSMFGSNPAMESYFLQQGLGISMPQASQLLKIFGPGGKGISGLQNNLGISASQLQGADWGKLALLGQLNGATSEKDLQSVISQYEAGGGTLSDAEKKALAARGANGDIGAEKSQLAHDILGGSYSPKTTTEKVDTLKADVSSAQINITGKVTSDLNSVFNNSKFNNFEKQHPSIIPSPWDTLKSLFDVGQTSYTPGGYAYSPAVIATAMGINGVNNAFSLLSTTQQGGNSGFTKLGYSSGTQGAPVGGNAKSFITNMYQYAQQASQKTGLPTSFILGQWGDESAWGTSLAALQNNNFAGIKPFGNLTPGKDSKYAGFSSISDFVDAYANTINSPRYAGAREQAAKGANAATIASLLQQEGYATDPNYSSGVSAYVASEAKAMGVDISDTSLAKLGQIIANVIQASGSGWSNQHTVPA